eukprot:2512516-Rhodomonas_salina.1
MAHAVKDPKEVRAREGMLCIPAYYEVFSSEAGYANGVLNARGEGTRVLHAHPPAQILPGRT